MTRFALALAVTIAISNGIAFADDMDATQQPVVIPQSAVIAPTLPPTVLEGTAGNFNQEVLQSQTPVLVEFYATWCPHCRHMTTLMQNLAQQYGSKLKVIRYDIDQNPSLADKYRVNGVPHFFVFKNGNMLDSIDGETDINRLNAGLNKAFM